MEQKRGQLTDRIKNKSEELLGYKIDVVELRLMVYVQYVMTNNHKIDRERINWHEHKILIEWMKKGYLKGELNDLEISREFWDIICEIIYLGYVNLK